MRDAAGTCRLDSAAGAAGGSRASSPRGPIPPPAQPGGPDRPAQPRPGGRLSARGHALHPATTRIVPRVGRFPVAALLIIVYRNEEKPEPALAKPVRELKQMNLLGFHPGKGLLSARRLALWEMAMCQPRGETRDTARLPPRPRPQLGGRQPSLHTEVGS